MDAPCHSCKHNLSGRCKLYNNIPILHDTRFCDGYERDKKEGGKKNNEQKEKK